MCGRYSFHLSGEELSELTGSVPEPFPSAVYNQPPGVPVPVLRAEKEWDRMPWGIEVSMGPDRRRLVINARSETAADKRMFQDSFDARRCVLPASGFFEWHRGPGSSQPYYFRPRTGPGILLAGLYLKQRGKDGTHVVVLTRAADDWMGEIHHRAPVLIRPDRLRSWLDSKSGGSAAVRDCSFPSEAESLERHPVSTRVSRVAENDPGILDRVTVEPAPLQGELFG